MMLSESGMLGIEARSVNEDLFASNGGWENEVASCTLFNGVRV
jgi:hypothetical protein